MRIRRTDMLVVFRTLEMPAQTIITFLGTAAANAFPEAFCNCRNCAQARGLGGRSLRKRSAALINNDLLVDLGPDIMAASQLHGRSLHQVRYCLQTHPHADHLDLSHLLSRSPEYGVVGGPVLEFCASRETLERAAQTFERDLAGFSLLAPVAEKRLNIKVRQILPFESFRVGEYSVTAFPANRAPGMGAMLYAVQTQDPQKSQRLNHTPFILYLESACGHNGRKMCGRKNGVPGYSPGVTWSCRTSRIRVGSARLPDVGDNNL
jgi:hypothetical protein